MRNVKYILIGLLLAVVVSMGTASAQYYDNGASPSWIRWESIADDSIRILAPDFYDIAARSVLRFTEATRPSIDFGLGYGVDKVPLVIHPLTSLSNGLSIWAPRRVEFGAMPAVDGYGTGWLRQLSVHEMRHSAQYAALNRNLVHKLYYLLGEQGLLLASGLMPFWWLEGDATDAETQMSLFGRALQPSFSMHYRAVGRDILADKNIDTWFGGSYNKEVPSHYELGYQLVSTANTLASDYVWDEVVEYASRHPYTIFATELAMRKRLGYSTTQLFRATFERLNDYWDSLPKRYDSARRIDERSAKNNYVQYQYPLWRDDSTIVVLRQTLDEPRAFVAVDVESGAERKLFNVGAVSSRPTIIGDTLYWTEHTQLSSFAQDVGSVLWCRSLTDTDAKAANPISRKIRCLYPTNYGGKVAYVRYNRDGSYTIVCHEGEKSFDIGVEIHGLAADGERLYFLTTTEGGMAIRSLDPSDWRVEIVKPESMATLSHLWAADGRLYFGSIESGYDEIHSWDLATAAEQRLTTSRYGSFWGVPSPDGSRLALALYDAEGYHPAIAPNVGRDRVEYSQLPRNVVNPPSYCWEGVVKVDTVEFTAKMVGESQQKHPAKKYKKGANLINIHSWAPIYFRPDEVMSGSIANVGLGLSATSQNLLNSSFMTVGWRYYSRGVSRLAANYKYVGLPVKLESNVAYTTSSAGVYPVQGIAMKNGEYWAGFDDTEEVKIPSAPKGYVNGYLRASLPIVLGHSYWTSVLTPAVEVSANNNVVYNPYYRTFSQGMFSTAATLQINSYTSQAKRNLQPRWGVAAIVGVGKSHANVMTPTTWGLFGRIYTPAFGRNDGFTIKASYQDIVGSGPLNYALTFGWLTPRGVSHFEDTTILPDDQFGGSVQYSTPLCYPDVGISGIVLLKRLSLSLFADGLAASVRHLNIEGNYHGCWSVGGDLVADTSWLRLPEQGDLSLRLSCYLVGGHFDRPVLSAGAVVAF